ncbi:hypothetical protein ACQY0O_003993 [Thecaphora frezii]
MSSILELFKSAFSSLSLELQNEGSVARDHLASERTFLAWLRTSLTLVSSGIAVTQIFRLPALANDKQADNGSYLLMVGEGKYDEQAQRIPVARLLDLAKFGKPIGAGFIVLGIFVLLLGCRRYFVVQKQLIRGKFPPSRISVSLAASLAGVLIVAASSAILAGERKSLASLL